MSTTPPNLSTYSYRINDFASPSGWNTINVFDVAFRESVTSPIDTFNAKIEELNRNILDPRNLKQIITDLNANSHLTPHSFSSLSNAINDTTNTPPLHANLILLGFISAVESYFREIIRRTVLIDDVAKKCCELKMIAFGAALFHRTEMLPEALLERVSFIDKENIKDVLKDNLDLKNITFPSSVDETLQEFESVCQLRHCIVHRYGKLGANNAIKLGLSTHSPFIEKPIKLKYNDLQNVAKVCSNLTKEINQFLWQTIMIRQIANPFNNGVWKRKTTPIKWTWNYMNDRKDFSKYFSLFSTQSGSYIPNKRAAYNEFKNKFNTLPV